jgi:hypothetical protein
MAWVEQTGKMLLAGPLLAASWRLRLGVWVRLEEIGAGLRR